MQHNSLLKTVLSGILLFSLIPVKAAAEEALSEDEAELIEETAEMHEGDPEPENSSIEIDVEKTPDPNSIEDESAEESSDTEYESPVFEAGTRTGGNVPSDALELSSVRWEEYYEGNTRKWYGYDSDNFQLYKWVKTNNKLYYFDQNGLTAVGLSFIDGHLYYFTETGYLRTGADWTWFEDQFEDQMGIWYYQISLDEGLAYDGVYTVSSGKKYLFNETGVMVTSGWHTVSGKLYFCKTDDSVKIGSYEKYNNVWYHLLETGAVPAEDITGDYLTVINVTENPYNADGTDNGVDQGINQATYDASKLANPDGKDILFIVPAGTYYVSDAILLFSNMFFQLDENATIIRTDPTKPLLVKAHYKQNGELCNDSGCTHGQYSQLNHVGITGGTWDGNAAANTDILNTNIISLGHASDITIRNTTIQNGNGLHLIVFDGCRDVLVENVTFRNQIFFTGSDTEYYQNVSPTSQRGSAIFNYELAQGKEALHFDYANDVGSANWPLDNTVSSDITVRNCTFDNVLAGTGAHHQVTGLSMNNITIENNSFTNVKSGAVYASQMINSVIRNNTVNNAAEFLVANEADLTLSDNTVSNVGYIIYSNISDLNLNNETYSINSSAFTKYSYSAVYLTNSTLVMKNSVINNPYLGAFMVKDTSSCEADNVTVNNAGGSKAAIMFYSNSRGTINNCRITGTKIGIYAYQCLSGSRLTISNNTIRDFPEYGIQILDSKNVSILSNIVINSGSGKDIDIWKGQNCTCTGNKITSDVSKNIKDSEGTNNTVNNNSVYSEGEWVKRNGSWYYFVDGEIATGWKKITGKWYFFNGSGIMQTGWQKISSVWYFFNASGAMQTGWQKLGNIWYYFNASGAMLTGWQKISSKWYYFAGSGAMQTGWQKISNVWYYFNASGAMQTSWQKLGNVWYYFNSSGAMLTGWQKINNVWYYFQSSGAMKTGWLKLNDIWYYFEDSGKMITGRKTINGKTYNFDSSGKCLNP